MASSSIDISDIDNDSQQEVEKNNDKDENETNNEKSGKKRSIVYGHFNFNEQDKLYHCIHCR